MSIEEVAIIAPPTRPEPVQPQRPAEEPLPEPEPAPIEDSVGTILDLYA